MAADGGSIVWRGAPGGPKLARHRSPHDLSLSITRKFRDGVWLSIRRIATSSIARRAQTHSRYQIGGPVTRISRGVTSRSGWCGGWTHRTTNFRGFTMKTPVGMRTKAMVNIATAARFSPPKTSMRSHRLTVRGDNSQPRHTLNTMQATDVHRELCTSPVDGICRALAYTGRAQERPHERLGRP